jgi:hypothetical protein
MIVNCSIVSEDRVKSVDEVAINVSMIVGKDE